MCNRLLAGHVVDKTYEEVALSTGSVSSGSSSGVPPAAASSASASATPGSPGAGTGVFSDDELAKLSVRPLPATPTTKQLITRDNVCCACLCTHSRTHVHHW